MLKTVSEIVKLQRLEICNSCDSFNKTVKTCKICHCYMPAKTMFASASCPSSKWAINNPGNELVNVIDDAILKSWNEDHN
jgi:hypothetical protein